MKRHIGAPTEPICVKIKVSNSVFCELFNLLKKKKKKKIRICEFSKFAYIVFTCVLATINIL